MMDRDGTPGEVAFPQERPTDGDGSSAPLIVLNHSAFCLADKFPIMMFATLIRPLWSNRVNKQWNCGTFSQAIEKNGRLVSIKIMF